MLAPLMSPMVPSSPLAVPGRGPISVQHARPLPAFTQPSYHPASTRIVLFDACSGVAVSMPWKRLPQCPSNERMACGIDVSGPASSGWVNKSPCSFSSADPFSRVGMKQTFRRRGAFWDRFGIIPAGRSIAVSPASVVSNE